MSQCTIKRHFKLTLFSFLDKASFVKAKINNTGVIALGMTFVFTNGLMTNERLGYTQQLRPGVKAAFALALDTQKLNEVQPAGPTHKVCLEASRLIDTHHYDVQVGLSLTFDS